LLIEKVAPQNLFKVVIPTNDFVDDTTDDQSEETFYQEEYDLKLLLETIITRIDLK
jgi:hypothetical protein